MPTLTIDNFSARLTRQNFGDINSGWAKLATTNSVDPFSAPKSLTWFEQPVQIDSAGSVITDLIVAGKERVESGICYVYCVGHTGRVYKIQVNKPSTNDPNFDTPVFLTTIVSGSPTFTAGGFMEFFGSTERMYIGNDKGVTRLDFDGTNETAIAGTWTASVPRPLKQFGASLYAGNGTNIAEISSAGTVTSSAKLGVGFPDNTQVRDMDISSDGTYLEIVVARVTLASIVSTTPDTASTANLESYIFKWNGSDTGYTSYESFPAFSLTANTMFQDKQFVFGYDLVGACVFNPRVKILSPILAQSPLPGAVGSNGNIVGWYVPEYVNGFLKITGFIYGSLDSEYPDNCWYRQLQMAAQGTATDIIRIPFFTFTSSLLFGSSSNGYTGGIFGSSKLYFSTLETTSAGVAQYKLYKFLTVPLGAGTPLLGTYETQNQMFSKKIVPKEIRVYTEPLVANNSFTISLIGSDASTAITGSTKTFAVGSGPVVAGQDLLQYNPATAPTYTLGVKITNVGTVNMTINKVEIDYEPAGK